MFRPWQVRVVASLACGSLIGFERRRADRAAGIRTMALVCLGSCVFTIASLFAFIGGPMTWDSSRVSAAIPSGVGFLGAASIWKGTRPSVSDDPNSAPAPEVHGLTTATSVWLSSAVGILCGGALYAPAIFTTSMSVVYLRFAPRLRRGLVGEQASSRSPTPPGEKSPGAPSAACITPVASRTTRPPIAPTLQAAAESGDLAALRVPLMPPPSGTSPPSANNGNGDAQLVL